MNDTQPQRVRDLVNWYETLTPASLEDISTYYTHDAHFRDPFHEFSDRESLYLVYKTMFRSLDNPAFHIDAVITDANDSAMYWRFAFSWRKRPITISGSSRIRFAADGRVESHVDYWDAASQVHERIPLVGPVIRATRKHLATSMLKRTDREPLETV